MNPKNDGPAAQNSPILRASAENGGTGPRQRRSPDERRQELILASIACLGEGGIAAFTIDRIRRHAGVSQGLINHHFRSKEALLVAVYETLTRYLQDPCDPTDPPVDRLRAMIERCFAPAAFESSDMRAWLALWGEITTNSDMHATHQARVAAFRGTLRNAIADVAERNGKEIDDDTLARTIIALVDGLWLQWCLDPAVMPRETAKAICYGLLDEKIGPIHGQDS